MAEQCLFCSILDKSIPAFIVYEDDHFIGVLDKFPATKGHTIFLPKKHVPSIYELSDGEYLHMMGSAKIISLAMLRSLGAKGMNILCSSGPVAGQRVPHAFVHIIPRYENDGVHIAWDNKQSSDEELAALSNTIKSTLFGSSEPITPSFNEPNEIPKTEEPKPQEEKKEEPKPQEKPKPRIPTYW